MRVHPAATIFPLLEGAEFDSLVTDIRANGLREAIWRDPSGRILDGRNRLRACKEAGVNPRYRTYRGNDFVAFVVSMNLRRRHLNESQRAMVGARMACMAVGRPTENAPIGAISQTEAAALVNVGRRSVQRAREVLDGGAVELIAAVDRGEVTVSDAAVVVGERHATQRACLKMVAGGKADTLKTAHRKRDLDRQRRDISAGRVTMPEGLFEVIAIDPPWPDEGGTGLAPPPYPTMSLEELAELDIPAAPDCILWCWVRNHFLHDGFHMLEDWGFEYKTMLTWNKLGLGIGGWLRSNTEHVLVATLGRPHWLIDLTDQSTIFEAQSREHSRKPDEFYELVDSLCSGRKLDYFSREKRDGWDQLGNDCARFSGAA